MCPHGLVEDQFQNTGICIDFVKFLLSLVNDGDSVNNLWENYNLYVLRLQSLEDYKSFMELQTEIDKLRKGQCNPRELDDLEAKRNTYKLWWSKLNDTVLRSIGRIVDREKRLTSSEKPRMSVQQLNVLINDNAEKLLDYEKGEK